MAEVMFEDNFIVTKVDPNGKKFDKVSRVEAKSEQLDMQMLLDVATEVYPMKVGERFRMLLTPTLNQDGTPDTGYYTQDGRETIADSYEYVVYGKIYNISENSGKHAKVELHASFGGLLMMLKGEAAHALNIEVDQRFFLLIRKL